MVDNGWIHYGVSAEIIALATENLFEQMICPPIRIGMNDSPSPSTRALANDYYPRSVDIAKELISIFNLDLNEDSIIPESKTPLDIPDPTLRAVLSYLKYYYQQKN